jgi:dTDP-4-dehydrorhamnose 3,5-epimerase
MNVQETSLPEVFLLTPAIYRDSRGAFSETWNQERFEKAGLPSKWVQDNFSVSAKHVVRGIHYQMIQPQAKLVRVAHGAVLDIAVDLRRTSPHFGRHIAVELSAENGQMLYIPAGFAYKVTDYYCREGERTILWNDPDLAIAWPVAAHEAIVSDKDQQGSLLSNAEVFA